MKVRAFVDLMIGKADELAERGDQLEAVKLLQAAIEEIRREINRQLEAHDAARQSRRGRDL